MAEQFKYDVFISHSSQDKPAVRDWPNGCGGTSGVLPNYPK